MVGLQTVISDKSSSSILKKTVPSCSLALCVKKQNNKQINKHPSAFPKNKALHRNPLIDPLFPLFSLQKMPIILLAVFQALEAGMSKSALLLPSEYQATVEDIARKQTLGSRTAAHSVKSLLHNVKT